MTGETAGVSDLVIDLGAASGQLAAAVGWLQQQWTLADLHDPAAQAAASAALTGQIPQLEPLLGRARHMVDTAGAAILRGVPAESDAMLVTVSRLLGPVQVIRPGLPLVDDLRPAAGETSATRNADSRRPLSPHTDSSVLPGAPEFFLVLGCVCNSDPAGGESTLIFVDEVARELSRRGAGNALALLHDRVFPNLNVPAEAGRAPVTTAVLGRRDRGTLVARFRHEALQAGLESPAAEVAPSPAHRQALADFTDAVLSPGMQRRVRLAAGDVLMADNGRVMHGRTAISPGVRRHLKRTFARRAGAGWRQTA